MKTKLLILIGLIFNILVYSGPSESLDLNTPETQNVTSTSFVEDLSEHIVTSYEDETLRCYYRYSTNDPWIYTYNGNISYSNIFSNVSSNIGSRVLYFRVTQEVYDDLEDEWLDLEATSETTYIRNVTYMNQIPDQCINSNNVTLRNYLVRDGDLYGVFTGTGIQNSRYFYPDLAGAGNHTITLVQENDYGIEKTLTFTIKVYELPNTTLSDQADICVDSSPIILTGGLPIGGVYSGTGISKVALNYYFNPVTANIGSHNITYTVTANGCSKSASKTKRVITTPIVTYPTPSPICDNDGFVDLTGGLPIGGTYSGQHILEGNFDSSVGFGSYEIIYTYTANGCSDNQIRYLQVKTSPTITMLPDDSVFYDDIAFTLTGDYPPGGNYIGIPVINNVFDPSSGLLEQNNPVTYTVEQNACTTSETRDIFIQLFAVSFNLQIDTVCNNSDSILLENGLPLGGFYSGYGVVLVNGKYYFVPKDVSSGKQYLTYSYTQNSVTRESIDSIYIKSIHNPPVIDLENFYCKGTNYSFTINNLDNTTAYWYENSELISNETSINYVIQGNTNFTIFLESLNGCTSDSTYLTILPDSVKAKFHSLFNNIQLGQELQFFNESEYAYFLLWDFNGEGASDLMNPWKYFNTLGEKTITLKAYSFNNCEDILVKENYINVSDVLNSVNNIIYKDFSIYPIPFDIQLNIINENVLNETTYTIINYTGKIVKSGKLIKHTTHLNTVDLPKGLYVISLFSDNEVYNLKVVK